MVDSSETNSPAKDLILTTISLISSPVKLADLIKGNYLPTKELIKGGEAEENATQLFSETLKNFRAKPDKILLKNFIRKNGDIFSYTLSPLIEKNKDKIYSVANEMLDGLKERLEKKLKQPKYGYRSSFLTKTAIKDLIFEGGQEKKDSSKSEIRPCVREELASQGVEINETIEKAYNIVSKNYSQGEMALNREKVAEEVTNISKAISCICNDAVEKMAEELIQSTKSPNKMPSK